MDIYCPKCREPWEIDSLHDEVSERFPSLEYGERYRKVFAQVRKEFYRDGCEAISGARCSTSTASPLIGEVYDLLGDDIDGAASLLDDASALGLL